jgi:hypothetical protein
MPDGVSVHSRHSPHEGVKRGRAEVLVAGPLASAGALPASTPDRAEAAFVGAAALTAVLRTETVGVRAGLTSCHAMSRRCPRSGGLSHLGAGADDRFEPCGIGAPEVERWERPDDGPWAHSGACEGLRAALVAYGSAEQILTDTTRCSPAGSTTAGGGALRCTQFSEVSRVLSRHSTSGWTITTPHTA